MIRTISGWFTRIAFAISFNRIVLPTRGAATIKPRCPRPSGVSRSTARALIEFVFEFSSMIRPSGKSGVRLSNGVGSVHCSAGNAFDRRHLVEHEHFLAIARKPQCALDLLPGSEMKSLDEGPRHSHVFRDREKIEPRPAQHAERIGHLIEKSLGRDRTTPGRARRESDPGFVGAASARDARALRNRGKAFRSPPAQGLEFIQIERRRNIGVRLHRDLLFGRWRVHGSLWSALEPLAAL